MNLVFILLNEQKIFVSELALMIYDLYKTNIDNEKSLKELLFNVLKFIKKLLKKSITFVITSDLLNEIKKNTNAIMSFNAS